VLELLQTPAFQIPLEIERAEHRARVLEALKVLAAEGLGSLAYPEAYGGEGAPGRAIAVFETLAFGDSSILIKFGVQFGLWGGSVYQLGTEKHHERWLRDIGTLELPGCYAMTEIGHGSNVRGLETVARWDEGEGAFVLHTPHEGAGKEWIGNAALHGRMATVFTQLRVGGEDHGVHALVVPIRDEDGALLPGIRIEDNGPKVGLNGIDNGRIWFDEVRVPRENLLDRFASVTEDGRYESPIDSAGRRFFTMLGTLVAGRISIAAASVSAGKVGLAVAVRYSEERRQFGPDDGPEVPILDYTSHQRRLLPRVAETYALHFAVRDLAERYAAVVKGRAGDRPGHGGTGGADADAASADTAGADAAKPGSRPRVGPTRRCVRWRPGRRASRPSRPGTPPGPCRSPGRPWAGAAIMRGTGSGGCAQTPTCSPRSRAPTPSSSSSWPRASSPSTGRRWATCPPSTSCATWPTAPAPGFGSGIPWPPAGPIPSTSGTPATTSRRSSTGPSECSSPPPDA
jgi:alkylation response protein AidB-like acyl-CoA dehydrogenase